MTILLWEPGRSGDDRMKLLDELVVRLELAVAVRTLGDEDINILNNRRIGQKPHLTTAEVSREHEPALSGPLPRTRAGSWPNPGCGRRHGTSARPPGKISVGFAYGSRFSRSTTSSTSTSSNKGSIGSACGLRWLALRRSSFWIRAPVTKHHAENVACRGRRDDRSVIAGSEPGRKAADMVIVCMRDDHRVEVAGIGN